MWWETGNELIFYIPNLFLSSPALFAWENNDSLSVFSSLSKNWHLVNGTIYMQNVKHMHKCLQDCGLLLLLKYHCFPVSDELVILKLVINKIKSLRAGN